MGGDRVTPPCLIPDEGLDSSEVDQESSQLSPVSMDLPCGPRDGLGLSVEDGMITGERAFVDEGYGEVSEKISPSLARRRKRCKSYREVLRSYNQLRARSESLKEAKAKVLSYTPGGWMEMSAGMNMIDYDVPRTTTLLLIGPQGSGKSSLVNRISRVFDDDKFSSERAQVSYNQSDGYGTYFLQEYMIPRASTSICLYDTRPLSDDLSDNIEMVKQWITKGVCSGKPVIRPSDSPTLRSRLKHKARQDGCQTKLVTMVHFVIFVVDGLKVLRSLNNGDSEGPTYLQMVATTYNCPYLSFKDDKPVVVVTHGDLLSFAERARVRVHLGELLGISPTKQVFDIPESCDLATELSIAGMMIYSLEHADKHIPRKDCQISKVSRLWILSPICLLIVLGIAILSIYVEIAGMGSRSRKTKGHVDWHTIRHLWLE